MEKTVPTFRMYLPKIRISRSTQLTIISLCFVFLFLYTGLIKLLDINSFQDAILMSSPIAGYAKFLSYAVPNIELIIAILLFTPIIFQKKKDNRITKATKIGLLASFGMMIGFTFYVGYILINFPNHLPCTCGGVISHLSWPQHLYFNIALLSLAGWSVWLIGKRQIKLFFAKIGQRLPPLSRKQNIN